MRSSFRYKIYLDGGGRGGGCFSAFVHVCHCWMHSSVDALYVNPVRAHPAGAKVGHCTEQIHF